MRRAGPRALALALLAAAPLAAALGAASSTKARDAAAWSRAPGPSAAPGAAASAPPVATAAARAPLQEEAAVLAEARAALLAKDPQKAADGIKRFLMTAVGSAELQEVCGQALLQLGRRDEAAHHFGLALRELAETEPARKQVLAGLARADPIYTRRSTLARRVAKDLLEICKKLELAGHKERALEMLVQLEPIASGAERAEIVALAEKIRAASREVDLDASGGDGETPPGEHPLVTVEGRRYVVEANLERAVAQEVSDVMDDIYNYYVAIYFDGDESQVAPNKPTIRIHPTHAAMIEHWDGPESVGGWWSPGEQKVVCYDTRTTTGKLDEMLMTLFHEASHHFMWMLAKGGDVPAWINEGTASFFEGATAMSDRRVLWPDAAAGRLATLEFQLRTGRGPTAKQTIAYDEPGSYSGEHYSFGWGLVYFLQQYEDPETLEYVYRPLYAQYREKIARTGAEPLALFEEIFLAPRAPGGFRTFDAWAENWKRWIVEEVHPLHFDQQRRRELRVAKARAYVAAADRVAGQKGVKVGESELLSRALGQLEHVLTKIDVDSTGAPLHRDVELMLLQADVLERLHRPQGTAHLLQLVLERVDLGEAELEPERCDELEKRLARLDARNQPLRAAKAKSKSFAKTVGALLGEYEASPVPMVLTAYEFARAMSIALGSPELAATADQLRLKAREKGLLLGALYRLAGKPSDWTTIFDRPDEEFTPGEGRVRIQGTRPVGRICERVPLAGEYEVRCTLERTGDLTRTSFQGVVFSGVPGGPWFVAGIDGKGKLVVRRYGESTERALRAVELDPPVAKGESPAFAVHVLPDDRIEVKVGARAPIEIQLEEALPKTAFVGVFAKNGEAIVRELVVEAFP